MAKTLTLAELVPERDQVEIAAGVKLDLLGMVDLDAIDAARAIQIKKRIEGLEISEDELSEEQAIAMSDALGSFLRIVLPDLTPEQLDGLRMGQRLTIINFWTANNQAGVAKNGRGQK